MQGRSRASRRDNLDTAMETAVRPATREQTDDIFAMLALQLEEHRIAIEPGALRSAIAGVFDDPSRGAFLLARVDDRFVGVAYVSFIWSIEHGGRSLWLDELFVRPELRERGIGRLLLEAVFALARAERCVAIDLEVDVDHSRVESLYQRHGFIAHERRRFVRLLE
jgi:GNAT superfamily N-acetyltransferase